MTEKTLQPILGQRIRAARKDEHLTLVELSKRIGISNQALSAIERGEKNPSKQTLINLSRELKDRFGVSWLEDQHEEKLERSRVTWDERFRQGDKETLREAFNEFLDFKFGAIPLSEVKSIVEGIRFIPVIARITSAQLIEEIADYDNFLIPARMTRPGKRTYCVLIESQSMGDALVSRGDIVVANEDTNVFDGKVAIVEIKGQISIRRLLVKGKKVTMIPFNSDYEPIKLPVNKIICLGEVTGVLRFIE
ncbi:MAG: S24 family peptidase [Pyrinomonadaceae bacterium]